MLIIRYFSLILLLAFFSFSINSKPNTEQHFTPAAKIYDQATCFRKPFDSYGSWLAMMQKSMKKRAKTELELSERLARFTSTFPASSFEKFKSTLSCITFKYKVGEEVVSGYLIRPKGQQQLPIIVYNRGGNGNYGGMVFGALMNRLMPLADEGFIIVGSQYRGTFQKGGLFKDEFGGADVEDVVSLVKKLKHLNYADIDAIGMYGSSRGGMQSMLALKQLDDTIKSVVISAGNFDLNKDLTTRPEMELVYEKRIPNYATEKNEQLRKRSALYWSSEINNTLPILLQHGDNDKKVNVYNSKALAQQFEETNRPYKLSIFDDDDHGLSNHRDEADNEVVQWFNKHLKQNY